MLRQASLVAVCALGCSTQPDLEPLAEQFGWLLGDWRGTDGERTESEAWTAVDENRLRGINETRVAGERVHAETLELLQTEDGVVYRANPSAQDTHDFRLEASGAQWARFSDPAHDWPQSIEYRRAADRLQATVTGTRRGEARTATWTWSLVGADPARKSP